MLSIIVIVKDDRGIEKTLSKLVKIPKPEKSEIIVVDASKGKLDDIKALFPYVKWIYFKNKSNKKITIPEQRNLGLKNSKGQIIVFIDADCIPTNRWLIELIEPIRKNGENIVSGFVRPTNNSTADWEINKFKRNGRKKYLSDAPTMNLAFRKTIIKDVGVFDEQFYYSSDTDFSWRVINCGYKIRYNPNAVIYHNYGSIRNNIKRHFNYGKARFNLNSKYPSRAFTLNSLLSFTYVIYILLLPLSVFWPGYILLLSIPVTRYTIESKNLRSSLYEVYFNLIEAIGYLTEGFYYLVSRSSIITIC